MKKVRLVAGAAAALPAAAIAAAPTPANAAIRWEKIINTGSSTRTASNKYYFQGGGYRYIHKGQVNVTCYYTGKSTGFASDKYWDHASWTSFSSDTALDPGHLADYFVDFSGRFPASAGIPKC